MSSIRKPEHTHSPSKSNEIEGRYTHHVYSVKYRPNEEYECQCCKVHTELREFVHPDEYQSRKETGLCVDCGPTPRPFNTSCETGTITKLDYDECANVIGGWITADANGEEFYFSIEEFEFA